MADALPIGWTTAGIYDVCEVLDGKRIPINEKERAGRLADAKRRFPYYGATGQVGEIDDFMLEGESILLGEDGAPFLDPKKPKAYLVDGKYWVNNHAHILRAKEPISGGLMCHQLNTIDYRKHVSGTTRLKLTQAAMRDMRLVVPPANEQRRIVSKIDELFSRIDEGEAALARVEKLVERYRQSVLKAAVTGELTRDWRAARKRAGEPVESGAALLTRILKARRAAWEAAELATLKAKGKPPADDRWKQKYQEPTPPDVTDLPELPDGWVWTTLEQLAAPEKNAITDGPFGANLKTEHYTESGARVIRLQNIKDGVFSDERAFISDDRFARLQKHRVFAGDLLVAALGEVLPRACIAPESLGPAIVKADCIRFKPSSFVSGACLMLFLNSAPSRHRTAGIVHGVGRPRLNLAEIRSLVIPLPSIDEQREIANRVDVQLSSTSELESSRAVGIAFAQALRQAILKAAFSGQLVPQDPHDEPASKLLERIAAERAAAVAPKNRRARRPQV